MFKRLVVPVLLFACPLMAHADGVQIYEDYAAHLRAAEEVSPLTSSEFGDQVSLYNGATEFDVVDIDVPGNNALPVQLRRRFDVSDRRANRGRLKAFGEWELDVPYVTGVFDAQYGWVVGSAYGYSRCSTPSVPYTQEIVDYIWDGYQLHQPGRGLQDLFVSSQPIPTVTSGTYPWITKDYTRFTCLPKTQNDPGEGFVAVSPDGTRTTFDYVVVRPYSAIETDVAFMPELPPELGGGGGGSEPIYTERNKIFILASKVQDRFGNTVNYNYTTDPVTGDAVLWNITSSDGRTITPTYTNGSITGATSNIGTWKYGYVSSTVITGVAADSLHTVTRPDNSQWVYTPSGTLHTLPYRDDAGNPSRDYKTQCQLDALSNDASFSYAVTAPFGATATYDFAYQRHYRSNIPLSCIDSVADHQLYPFIFDFEDNFTLDSKKVTGPGLAAQTWTYGYGEGPAGDYFTANVPGYTLDWSNQDYVPPGDCPACRLSKQVLVTSPTEITRYTFGVEYGHNEGRLLGTEIDGLDGTVLRTTTNTFLTDTPLNGMPFPDHVGTVLSQDWKNPMAAWTRPQQQSAIVQDGVTFTNQANAWDVFARPTNVTRSTTNSSGLAYAKTETTAYADNTTNWVIGQVATVTDNASGLVEVENDYDPASAMLASTKSFGALQKSYTYNADGTLNTVADGLQQTTTLSNWFRGVPQNVAYADTTTESAVVNDSGWITSTTDENGFTTGYGYDAMGRVNEVDYPPGDSVAWMPTLSSFVKVNSAEYGLDPGHWRQIVSTGTSHKTTYFDAMLRPVLKREEDTSNAATIRYTEQAFDAANRTVFASYPSATASLYNDLTLGTRTSFDGLGRPTRSTQDSELLNAQNNPARLATSYNYLPDFITQVTNPRGQSTTTAYQTFDTPDTSHPTVIASPMGVTTTIVRDLFGKPLSITRSGTSNSATSGTPVSEARSYVYDANQRLCERVEPETGATLMDYDAAGNVSWTESGSTSSASLPCINATAPADGITRTYDPRNRVLTQTVPGSTNTSWRYHPDGQLWILRNGTNAWTYGYDKRRLPVTETLSIDGRSEVITHGYDARGHENSLTYPDGLVINTNPNALGQPRQAGPYATGVSYFPNGAMSDFTYGNGIVHTLTQNTRGLPLESLDQAPGAPAVLDDTYTYDPNGNVTGIADGTAGNANGRTMSYDALDRLKGTAAPGQPWISASTTYDGLDNVRSNTVGNRTYNYIYDNTWRLSQINQPGSGAVMTPGYDANGNVTGKGNGYDSYSFDVANRMQSVTGKEAYAYDGYGRRVKITRLTDSKIDYPIYDMTGQLLTEDDQRTNTTTDFVSLNGSLVGKRAATIGGTAWTKTYEHTDALHSPISVTNGSGVVVSSERYTPYGEPSDGTYTQGPGFTGHVTDAATGLTYAQQRYYDPVIGRFLSGDPVQADDNGGDFNRYWYAGNNPYKFTDPDGRAFLVDDAIGIGVGSVLGVGKEEFVDLAFKGRLPTYGEFWGSALTGGIDGEAVVNAPETMGGTLALAAGAGAAGSALRQKIDTGQVSVATTAGDAAISAVTAGVGRRLLPDAGFSGITKGSSNMASIYKGLLTKLENGTIKKMSAKSAAKGVLAKQAADLYHTIFDTAADAGKQPAKDAITQSMYSK